MAIDMLDLAYLHKINKNNLDTIVILSSDSDLKPVIKKIKLFGINVEYVGFEHMYSMALLDIADKSLLLTEKQLEDFLPRVLL